MTREEQLKQAAIDRYGNNGNESQYMLGKIQAFVVGARYADEHPNGSQIKWQTGTPKYDGYYIVTSLLSDETPYVHPLFRAGHHWFTTAGKRLPDPELVVGWVRLRDIKPYYPKNDTP